ncbi:CBS domain-containing protein [bacterium]|nr:CBS domain-containing protein [bacterium]
MTELKTKVILRELVAGKTVLTLSPEMTISAAAQAMQQAKKGAALIVDGKKLCGIFTERDLVNRVVAVGLPPQETPLKQVMTTNLVVIHPDDSHWTAISVMVTHQIRHLPVVEGDQVLGIVSRRQLMALDNAIMEADIERREASRLFL